MKPIKAMLLTITRPMGHRSVSRNALACGFFRGTKNPRLAPCGSFTPQCSIKFVLLVACVLGFGITCHAAEDLPGGEVRLAAYNVLFGNWGEPERIGEMFKPYRLDIIGFNEVPDGDWTARVGRVLGMKHVYVGKIASANHKDKYKSILSRTPLTDSHEISVECNGWSPASMVGAKTVVRGIPLLVYSTHIPERPITAKSAEGSAAAFIANSVIPKITAKNFVIMGDLNNVPGDAALNLIEGKGMRSAWSDLTLMDKILSTHLHIDTGTESGLIDHIYFNKSSQAKAVKGGVIYNAFNPPFADKEIPRSRKHWLQYGKPLSDHRPVWAVLRFRR